MKRRWRQLLLSVAVAGIALLPLASAAQTRCDVVFGLVEGSNIHLVSLSVNDGGLAGRFAPFGVFPFIDCQPLLAGAGAVGRDVGVSGDAISLTISAPTPSIAAGVDLASCRFDSSGGSPPEAEHFVVETVAAIGPVEPIIPPPASEVRRVECSVIDTTTSTVSTTTTTLMDCVCGDPVSPGPGSLQPRAINATDALFTLKAGVGLEQCAACACDVNGSGTVNATDALIILRFAIGQPVVLDCPPAS